MHAPDGGDYLKGIHYTRRNLILLTLLVAVTSVLIGSCSLVKSKPVRVVLITLDTTRADHMGFMGGVARTPALDNLAADSFVFENCFSTANSTLPSHASIMTSLYIKDHSVIENAYRLPDLDLYMPKVMAASGAKTAAFTSTGLFSGSSNFDQGFEMFYSPRAKEEPARPVTSKALAWLENNADGDFFVWMHYYDPHMYYTPPQRFADMYKRTSTDTYDNPSPTRFSKMYHKKNDQMREAWTSSGYLKYSDDPQFYRNLYAGEISYMDSELGRLIDGLKSLGVYDDCVIAVVADHGESLGEKGIYFDHAFIYDKNIHVPMFIKPPSGGRSGRSGVSVSSLDIYPTVLELAGIEVPDGIRGRSLAGVMDGSSGFTGRDTIYYEHILENFIGIKTPEYTYIANMFDTDTRTVRDRDSWFEELYSADDPSQSTDISPDNPEAIEKFRTLAEDFYKDRSPGPEPEKITDESHAEKLKALGYVQ